MKNNNFAHLLTITAKMVPDKRAIVFPSGKSRNGLFSYTHYTFSQLDKESDKLAENLRQTGIKKGTKTLLMVQPSLEYIVLVFAILKAGGVIVLIDPGMGVSRLLDCIKDVSPEAYIAIPKAQLIRMLSPKNFKNVKINVTVGKKFFFGGYTLTQLQKTTPSVFETVSVSREDLAALIFTTGSTGPAKGVEYTHGLFLDQCKFFKEGFNINENDIDLPILPLFAIYSVAIGMTVCIPDMDASKPAHADPAKIVATIEDQGVTFSFGSPALWNVVADYCIEHDIKLTSIKKVLMGGAPVRGDLLERMEKVITNGEVYTPYGSVECLPVTNISTSEIIPEKYARWKNGEGTCVGKPMKNLNVKILKISDQHIGKLDKSIEADRGEIGEIIVSGPLVTKKYHQLEEKTRMAKIDDNGTLWHRMGDLGYLDKEGNIWFCGRITQRVVSAEKTYYTIPCEAIFNQHEKVSRSALVGVKGKPVIVIEPIDGKFPRQKKAKDSFVYELLQLSQSSPLTRDIETIVFHKSFPVDSRHNAKIFREQLKVWAEKQVSNG